MRNLGLSGLAALCLLASACGQDEAAAPVVEGDDTSAKGEVLEGTISDRMIPYDEIGRNAPPPVPVAAPAERRTPAAAATERDERGEANNATEASVDAEPGSEAEEPADEE